MAKVELLINREDEKAYGFLCPGCNCTHIFWTQCAKGPVWKWNGDFAKPTIHPSLVYFGNGNENENRCHSFVTNGRIQFLADCTHSLAGQTVELPEID